MHTHTLPNTDLKVSALCYGSVGWGTSVKGKRMDRLLDAFRDAGGNFFDTAHAYSFWMPGGTASSELTLADYFQRRGGSKGMVIATKGGHPSAPNYRTVDQYLSPGRVGADVDDSLARLRLDTIDLYWLHRDDTRLEAGEIIQTLNAEVKRGRIRYLGASNWTAARIAAANAYAAAHGLRGFVASQPRWNLAKPGPQPQGDKHPMRFLEDEARLWHEQSKIPVIPYSPNSGGFFTRTDQATKAKNVDPVNLARRARARKLAKEVGCTPGQIALAFLMNHGFPVIPILGTTKLPHLREALGAVKVKLTAQQVAWVRDG